MSLQPPPVLRVNHLGSRVELELQLSAGGNSTDDPFAGHFPEQPVLPGVVQLHWAVELAQHHLQIAAAFRELVGVKFQKVMQPGLRLNLELEFDSGELRFRYHAGGDTYSSGKLRVADA